MYLHLCLLLSDMRIGYLVINVVMARTSLLKIIVTNYRVTAYHPPFESSHGSTVIAQNRHRVSVKDLSLSLFVVGQFKVVFSSKINRARNNHLTIVGGWKNMTKNKSKTRNLSGRNMLQRFVTVNCELFSTVPFLLTAVHILVWVVCHYYQYPTFSSDFK